MQNRKSPERITQPMRSAAAQRSGQLARLTEETRAPGRTVSCCDVVTVDGGDCLHPPQQPCSRHLYNAGPFRLPGGRGLDETRPHGRRRANARDVRRLGSFGSLLMENGPSNARGPFKSFGPVFREPGDDFIIFLHSEGLPLTNTQEETAISGAKATDRGLIQLAGSAVCTDQLQQM